MSNKGAVSANDLPRASEPPVAHPLARELAQELASQTQPVRVLVLGVGSGRNLSVLLAGRAHVQAIEEDDARFRDVSERFPLADVRHASYAGPYPFANGFAGALSTHALLHGRRARIASAIEAVRAALAPGASFLATLGSTRDPRFGVGHEVEDGTYVPTAGPEAGVEHSFFDEAAVRSLFLGFASAQIAEVSASETAGRWAHSEADASTLVHWFVRARVGHPRSASDAREGLNVR